MAGVGRKACEEQTPSTLSVVRLGVVTAFAVIALALVGGAKADLSVAPITLDVIAIADDVATVTGSLGDVTSDLEINGLPVDVDADGDFTTLVDLEKNVVVVSLLNDLGERTTFRIPVNVLVENDGGVLDNLLASGVSIDVPIDGFEVIDGQGPIVVGSILSPELLRGVWINDVDVLDHLGPSGAFAVVLPWQSAPAAQQVTVVVVDRRGVSQTSAFRTTSLSSAIRTRAGTSVSAAGARGVRIARIVFDRSQLRPGKTLAVTVTVKDSRGFLVRGAALRLTGTPSRYLAAGAVRAGFTNRAGQARFTYRLHARAFASCGCTRLAVTVRASTIRAATKRTASLRLPTLAR
jgi:hypothetical protein